MRDRLDRINAFLLRAADSANFGSLFVSLCEELVEEGVPLWRASAAYQTLDPVVRARTNVWQREGAFVRQEATHVEGESQFLHSPIRHLLERAQAFGRWRLDRGQGDPFPLVPWARAPGALPAAASVAVLIAALGWLLMQGADWNFRYIGAALSGYIILAAGVGLAAAWHLRGIDFGLANQVTLLRSGLVCLAGGALLAGGHAPSASWSLAAIIGIALSLDAVDGWLARRLGLASRFGARFDLEIDALLILILAVLVWQTGRVGAWLLAIGGMRYGFAALGIVLPMLRRPLPPSRPRKAVCAMLGVLLLICLLPPTPAWLAWYAAALALAAQLASFGIDTVWLARHAGPMATAPGSPLDQHRLSVIRAHASGSGGRPPSDGQSTNG